MASRERRFAPEDLMVFVQARKFSERWDALRLTDDDLHALEIAIMSDPNRSPIMQDTGGLRKMRFAPPGSGRGKSGAFRVCYVYFEQVQVVHLLVIYAKNEKDNISAREKAAIKKLIAEIRQSLSERSYR